MTGKLRVMCKINSLAVCYYTWTVHCLLLLFFYRQRRAQTSSIVNWWFYLHPDTRDKFKSSCWWLGVHHFVDSAWLVWVPAQRENLDGNDSLGFYQQVGSRTSPDPLYVFYTYLCVLRNASRLYSRCFVCSQWSSSSLFRMLWPTILCH